MTAPTVHRDIAYWPTYADARYYRDAGRTIYPDIRIVAYGRGYAVQREPSGPYLGPNPEPDKGSPGAYGFH